MCASNGFRLWSRIWVIVLFRPHVLAGLGPPVPSEPATFSGGQMAAGALVLDLVYHLTSIHWYRMIQIPLESISYLLVGNHRNKHLWVSIWAGKPIWNLWRVRDLFSGDGESFCFGEDLARTTQERAQSASWCNSRTAGFPRKKMAGALQMVSVLSSRSAM